MCICLYIDVLMTLKNTGRNILQNKKQKTVIMVVGTVMLLFRELDFTCESQWFNAKSLHHTTARVFVIVCLVWQ